MLAGASLAFALGAFFAGAAAGLALAAGQPGRWRASCARGASAYRRAVDSEVPGIALAVADALAGGHSLRSALGEATRVQRAPPGTSVAPHSAAELAAGAPTEQALEAMRSRVRSSRLDTVVAACLLQRNAGGDLARLLRDSARAMEESSRLEGELRAATAQAPFLACWWWCFRWAAPSWPSWRARGGPPA